MIDKLVNRAKNYLVNWDYVWSLPHFAKLKEIPHHTYWHQEGSPAHHTKNVVSEIHSLKDWMDLTDFEKECLVLAALYHDVGKGVTTKLNDDGNWGAPHHASVGERIARYDLWDEDFNVRETVCSLVRYHMKPNHLLESGKDPDKTIIEMSHNTNIKLLYLLTICDSLGATSPDTEETLIKKGFLRDRAIELGCWDKPYEFYNNHTKFTYFRDGEGVVEPTSQIYDPTDFTVYLMCGVSGSGKDTYIEKNLPDLPVVSRDIIRAQIGLKGLKPKGDKKQEAQVTVIEQERMKELARSHTSFVISNMHIRKQHRDGIISLLAPYNPKFVFVYVETSKENNISRRGDAIPAKIITSMQQEMQFPYNTECYEAVYTRN